MPDSENAATCHCNPH